MGLIDSPTDLIATASRQIPQSNMKMERFGLASEDPTGTQFSSNDYDYLSSWQDDYLRGSYEKRVEDLEKFAQDKNFWASAVKEDDEDVKYINPRETGRRQRFRPTLGRPKRRRPIAHRRKDYEYDKEYDKVDPSTFSDIYGSSSTPPEDVYQTGYQGDPNQDQNGLIKRVSNAIFNPLSETIFTIVAIPLIIAAVYWLFVVNGPTPVVKARIEDMPLQEDVVEEKWKVDLLDSFGVSKVDWNDFLLQALKVFVPVTQKE